MLEPPRKTCQTFLLTSFQVIELGVNPTDKHEHWAINAKTTIIQLDPVTLLAGGHGAKIETSNLSGFWSVFDLASLSTHKL